MFGIKNPFKREVKTSDVPEIFKPVELGMREEASHIEPKEKEERKNEFEVLIAKIDALKFQYEAVNEKISNIEKMVREIYEMAKSSS